MFVLVSSMSFLIPPTSHPARCGVLLTTLLVLVNMFNSVLSNTPSDSSGLTALSVWILVCITFVFSALFLYIIILVQMKNNARNNRSLVGPTLDEEKDKGRKDFDFDPIFLVVHITLFIVFVIVYVSIILTL